MRGNFHDRAPSDEHIRARGARQQAPTRRTRSWERVVVAPSPTRARKQATIRSAGPPRWHTQPRR